MDMKSGYKKTDVGVIPEDWELRPLGEVANVTKLAGFEYSNYFNSYNSGGTIIVIRGTNITHNRLDLSDVKVIPRSTSLKLLRSKLFKNDLVFAYVGTIGPVYLVEENDRFHLGPNTSKISVGDSIDSHFLFHLFTSWLIHREIVEYTSVGAQPSLSMSKIRKFKLAVPTNKTEQEAIAKALTDTDALIESLEQLIAKKRLIKQGTMQELLTGKKRLSGFAGKWEEWTLFDVAGGRKELFDDGDWIESEHITNEGIRLIQTGNIGVGVFLEKDDKKYICEKSFVSLRCKEIKRGDLLICRLADPAGRSCILPDINETKIITSVDVTIFRPPISVVNRVFLVNMFSTAQWFRQVADQSGGTTRKRISRGALGRIKIKLPAIGEQNGIASILTDMNTEIGILETKVSKLRQFKQGIMQELLTGRIRLV